MLDQNQIQVLPTNINTVKSNLIEQFFIARSVKM